ncbi:hypothetical protein FJZ40_04335 [Candidatus Shapirobacteria bacterium]|nr:hypothetical protein [Candidatus Shapirobacteria bacterium]
MISEERAPGAGSDRRERALWPHRLKAEVVRGGVGTFVDFSFAEAAQAFGTSEEVFLSLRDRQATLVVQPALEGVVRVGLIRSVPKDPTANLWNQLLNSLGEGRSAHGEIKAAYMTAWLLVHFLDEQPAEPSEVFLARLGSEGARMPESLLGVAAFKEMWDNFCEGKRPDEEMIDILVGYAWTAFGQLRRGTQEMLLQQMSPFNIRSSRALDESA